MGGEGGGEKLGQTCGSGRLGIPSDFHVIRYNRVNPEKVNQGYRLD